MLPDIFVSIPVCISNFFPALPAASSRPLNCAVLSNIHDWEVQAASLAYRRRYGDKALEMMQQKYGGKIPKRNPHFIMGTMKAHPQTFITIGILRSGIDPAELDKQGGLF